MKYGIWYINKKEPKLWGWMGTTYYFQQKYKYKTNEDFSMEYDDINMAFRCLEELTTNKTWDLWSWEIREKE